VINAKEPIQFRFAIASTTTEKTSDGISRGRGATTILDDIRAEVAGGFCACEVKNLSGAWCLGDIICAIQNVKKHAAATIPASR